MESEMQSPGGEYELDVVRPGSSSLAVDHGRLRLWRLQIYWKCFERGAQRDH